jgi:hypothetical protein
VAAFLTPGEHLDATLARNALVTPIQLPPGQARDLLGPETRFDRQQEDDPIPGRPSALCQVAKDGFDLPLTQFFACLPSPIWSSSPVIYGLQDAGQ